MEIPKPIILTVYISLWLREIAPGKLAESTIRWGRSDIVRIPPTLGCNERAELRRELFRSVCVQFRKIIRTETRKPLSRYTVEGVHAMCSILSDAVEGGFLRHNPVWRTDRCAGRKTEKNIANAGTVGKMISVLGDESIKNEACFKLPLKSTACRSI